VTGGTVDPVIGSTARRHVKGRTETVL